jgi:chromosome segregation ATPase
MITESISVREERAAKIRALEFDVERAQSRIADVRRALDAPRPDLEAEYDKLGAIWEIAQTLRTDTLTQGSKVGLYDLDAVTVPGNAQVRSVIRQLVGAAQARLARQIAERNEGRKNLEAELEKWEAELARVENELTTLRAAA